MSIVESSSSYMTSVLIKLLSFIPVAILCLWFRTTPPLTTCVRSGLPINESNLQENVDREAVRIWEEAIAAKGGRERLHKIESILISSRVDYITKKGKKNVVRRESLDVLPNKLWSYEDYGSDVFGTTVRMFNYENMTMYFGVPGRADMRTHPLKDTLRTRGAENVAISLLLETKWLKPVLLRARTDTIGATKVAVVETRIDGRKVDFAFDQRLHLPVQVSFYDTGSDDKSYVNVQRFSDYIEVSGIQVPQTLTYSDGTVERSAIQFNVDYNPQIFVTPPSKADPQAWKLMSRK